MHNTVIFFKVLMLLTFDKIYFYEGTEKLYFCLSHAGCVTKTHLRRWCFFYIVYL